MPYTLRRVHGVVGVGLLLMVLSACAADGDSDGADHTGQDEGELSQVRVEVHLSNGVELGPTTPTDLPAGRVLEVSLDAIGETFDSWSAHPEVGEGGDSGEHAGESEEHDSSESGEHEGADSGEHGG